MKQRETKREREPSYVYRFGARIKKRERRTHTEGVQNIIVSYKV